MLYLLKLEVKSIQLVVKATGVVRDKVFSQTVLNLGDGKVLVVLVRVGQQIRRFQLFLFD